MPLDYTILAPSVVTKIVSRIAVPGNTIQRLLGFEPGGRNVEQMPYEGARSYYYDIFDAVRDIARGRAPGSGPGTRTKNPVGSNMVTIARSYEKIPDLSYEMLNNIRQIGENAGSLDKRGMRYLEAQGRFMAQLQNNFREFLSWIMLRGSGGFTISGDQWEPAITSPDLTINFQIPAGNLTHLNMLGAGSILGGNWGTTSTKILDNLDSISIAFQQLVGAPLDWIATDSVVFGNVLNNTQVQTEAGTANVAFDVFELTGEKSEAGFAPTIGPAPTGLRYAVLRGRPMYKWFITDAGLNVNGTFTKFFNSTGAGETSFGVDLNLGFAKMQEGSELVKESPWAPPVFQRGLHTWLREWDEPARVELHAIQNIVPELTVPKALALGNTLS